MDLRSFDGANACRFVAGRSRGHYESYFIRANHPTRPLAFWIRYTIFSPRGRPDATVGELWAIVFNGESGRHVAAKTVVPWERCRFSGHGLGVDVGDAHLGRRAARGSAGDGAGEIAWDLAVEAPDGPALLLLPRWLYGRPLPRAKSIVPAPAVRFSGTLRHGGEATSVDGWTGSQNHNWGSAHTDRYAWGQVSGFDDAPDAFFECATVRYRAFGGWTPPLTTAVLRLGDEVVELNALRPMVGATATIEGTRWAFESRAGEVTLRASFTAPQSAFVGLRYDNPPGGTKICQNSKIARCDLELVRRGRPTVRLQTQSRAAFELLDDSAPPGLAVAV